MNATDLLCPDAGFFVALAGDRTVAFDRDSELKGAAADVSFEPSGPSLELTGNLVGTEEIATGTATGTLRADGSESTLECHAITTRRDPADGAEIVLRRSLAVSLMDGGLFALAGARDTGAKGHGDEDLAAAFAGPGEALIGIDEVLLSTEYDTSGVPRRATLELFPTDDESGIPLRGAGNLISAAHRTDDGWDTHICFFRWSIEARGGLGRYEVSTRR